MEALVKALKPLVKAPLVKASWSNHAHALSNALEACPSLNELPCLRHARGFD